MVRTVGQPAGGRAGPRPARPRRDGAGARDHQSGEVGLGFSADLRRALEAATCGGTGLTFVGFLERAAGEERRGRSRNRRPVTVVRPGSGLPAAVLDAYAQAVEFHDEIPPVVIRWRNLPDGDVFQIDQNKKILNLNLKYRKDLVGRRSLDPEGAPVIEVLIHPLLSRYFEGAFLGR